MTERRDHPASTESETASLTGSGEIRKGIEIVTVRDMPFPSDYAPSTMGLGGPPPTDPPSESGPAQE